MTKIDLDNKMESNKISADEAQLYDRQIRLWGVEAQRKLRQSKVLMIGLSGVASEIVKNIVLSGINSLTILDDKMITEHDSLSHLFTQNKLNLNRGEASIENIQALNPLVNCSTMNLNVIDCIEKEDETLIKLLLENDIVCITNYDSQTVVKLNNLLRKLKNNECKFYSVNSWGYFAFACVDLGKIHRFIVEEIKQTDVNIDSDVKSVKTEEKEKTFIEKTLTYPKVETIFSVKSGKSGVGLTKQTDAAIIIVLTMFKFFNKYQRFPMINERGADIEKLKEIEESLIKEHDFDERVLKKLKLNCDNWYKNVFGEISPITSIVGGIIGQDIIRAMTAQDTPIKNTFIFNGLTCSGNIETFGV